MKKVLAMLGVVLFSASAFALNAVAPVDENCPGKAEFENYAAGQGNNYFITQNILMNLSDPMEQLTDEEALPQALCYATYRVKGKDLVSFVRFHKGEFLPREEGQLAAFANRVEKLAVQNKLNKLSKDQSNVMQWVLTHLAEPMASKRDEEAKDSAKVYKACRVNGLPLMEYVRVHASEYPGDVAPILDAFVERVYKLVK